MGTGLSHCAHCGATVGTLFSDVAAPIENPKSKRSRKVTAQSDHSYRIDKAQERANNSIILALASFFCPGIGFLLGITAIILATMAGRALKEYNVEDGRGTATAGLLIGILGLIAQAAYVVYVVKSGKMPLIG